MLLTRDKGRAVVTKGATVGNHKEWVCTSHCSGVKKEIPDFPFISFLPVKIFVFLICFKNIQNILVEEENLYIMYLHKHIFIV